MQLKNKKIKQSLSLATSALMMSMNLGFSQESGVPVPTLEPKVEEASVDTAAVEAPSFGSSAAEELSKWDFKGAILYYKEQNRVNAVEPVLEAKRSFDKEDRFLNFRFVLDVLSGPSPNGATSTQQPQTFSSPSGGKTYTAAAGSLPMIGDFQDTRIAANLSWQEPLGRTSRLGAGVDFSNQYDFMSYGGSLSYQRDLNDKNTTFNVGVSYENDTISPVGGIPIERGIEGTPTTPAAVQPRRETTDSKNVIDGMLGLTQVFNRHLIAEFNYGLSRSSGYLEDPYKLFSVVDAADVTQEYQFEQRPNDRLKHSLFSLVKYIIQEDILSFSYRFMTDSWGINSHTVDMRYRSVIAANKYLEPHLRIYSQSAADFYSYDFLNTTLSANQNASADYRLGAMMAYTVGLKFGFKAFKDHDAAIKAEYYLQKPKDKQEDLRAIMLNLSYYL